MVNLENLTTSAGVINIVEQTAPAYRKIGTQLLNDRYGTRVDNIESDEKNSQSNKMRRIYHQWIAEDKHHSWTTLTECFRVCDLNTLASIIEEHFGLSPPVQEGTVLYIQICSMNTQYLYSRCFLNFV